MQVSLSLSRYGVLITTIETDIKRIFARATHSSEWSQDVELPANTSPAKLQNLSNIDVFELSQKRPQE